MQAEHEAPVTAIGLAPDGLTIAIGTENGVIGCLDVPTHQYRTLLRSHTDTVNAVAVDIHRCWQTQHWCHSLQIRLAQHLAASLPYHQLAHVPWTSNVV